MFLRENLSSERCRNSTNSTLYLRHCSNATAGREVEQNWWTFSIFECNFDQAWSIAGNSGVFKNHDCRILLKMPQSVFFKIIEPPKMQHEDVLRFS
jgi:hypothetical protein